MLLNHLRTAIRNVWKQRSTNAINVTGLAAGMTAAILIFLWVENELTYDAYHPGADHVYRIRTHLSTANWTWETTPLLLAPTLTREDPELEAVTRFQFAYSLTLQLNNTPLTEKNAAYVDSNWFKLFHYDFVAGNPANFFSQPYSLLLTQSKAKKYFGDKDPIGSTLRIDSNTYRVAAIVKDLPANSSFQSDMLIPLDALLSQPDVRKNETSWGNFNYLTFVRLRPTASPAKVTADINRIMKANRKDDKDQMTLTPLTGIHFETGLTSASAIERSSRKTVYIFSVLGVFLLVIACINYVNLTTARASVRAKEIGIRKIIGAGRKSLFIQFMSESLVVSTVSLLITLLLITVLMPFFRELTGKHFAPPLGSLATWKVLGFTLLAATLLNGVYPALILSSFRPLNVLRGSTLLRFKDVYLRKGLVVLQFTFSIILIIGTIVIQRQLSFIQHTDPGYQRSQAFYFRLPWSLIKQRNSNPDQYATTLSTVKQQLLAQTGIAGVSVASQSIVDMSSSNSGSADWDGHDTSFVPTVFQMSVDEDYAKVLQLQLQQGHWFDPLNGIDKHNFILNETAVSQFNIRKPVLGQRFSFQGDTGKIIGVVKDFHFASMHKAIGPLVFFNKSGWRSMFVVKTEPGKTPTALAAAQKILQSLAPSEAFDYTFLDDQFDRLYKADAKVSTLILVFSIVAILISCLGLFALAAFTAQQRIKEIGIRKVLGASVPNIIGLLSRDFVRLVGLSIVIATPIAAYAMHKWLEDFAYHIPLSAGFFIAGGSLALVVAILTVSSQSVRAATSNPIKSLRNE